ncbi:hypothetical protein Patl1_28924 [Pistacia atlantica]|uniref:Uncharacterized protein n=1 Tax=Pistacia atlantica TaxID=434234 RepID=A0ACC1BD66_9ROSI|nr:hypothetical protein Patl1_28924 [Pistacia atlantica]
MVFLMILCRTTQSFPHVYAKRLEEQIIPLQECWFGKRVVFHKVSIIADVYPAIINVHFKAYTNTVIQLGTLAFSSPYVSPFLLFDPDLVLFAFHPCPLPQDLFIISLGFMDDYAPLDLLSLRFRSLILNWEIWLRG